MSSISNLTDLFGKHIVIYGAGATGKLIYGILTKKINGINIDFFIDKSRVGVDSKTGLKIEKPEEIKKCDDALVIIGFFDYRKPRAVQEAEQILNDLGFPKERILRFSELIKLLNEHYSYTFSWENYVDDVYDFDSNSLLNEHLSACIDLNDGSVVDLGAGNMILQKHISPNTVYYPVDFKKRFDETFVCNFNLGEFLDIDADVYVLCAMLYYIDNPVWLLQKCAAFAQRKIIVALNAVNFADLFVNDEEMRLFGIKNNMYFDEIAALLRQYGFLPSRDVVLEDILRRYVVYEKSKEK